MSSESHGDRDRRVVSVRTTAVHRTVADHDGLSVESLGGIQRARLLAAITDIAYEQGAASATVAKIVARAGVSRRTFYELYEDREDCFLAAFEEGLRLTSTRVLPAYRGKNGWAAPLRAALAQLLLFLEDDPRLGRLLIASSLQAGPRVLIRRQEVLARLVEIIEQGRTAAKKPLDPPPFTAEGLVGGALSLIHERILAGGGAPLIELLGPLMAMIVLPYLGPVAARRELTQPTPVPRNVEEGRGTDDPLRGLGMRLTYRTVRVLAAVGALGENGSLPSNREVGDAAGIRDPGQISKLLARLRQLELVRNSGDPDAPGVPNAWMLTERGLEVRRAISNQTVRG